MLKAKYQNYPETGKNNDTKKCLFPGLIKDVLKHLGQCADNVFAGVWKGLNISRLRVFARITGHPFGTLNLERENIDWRGLNSRAARTICQHQNIS